MVFVPFIKAALRNRSLRLRRSFFNQIHPLNNKRPSFGIAFDVDGVIIHGREPIGKSPQALRKLYSDDGSLKIPFLFLTNGGGVPESKRATELSELLGVKISPLQVVQGHSAFRNLMDRYENEFVVAVGKGEPAEVMTEYGFKKVLSMDDYVTHFSDIDPLSPYKSWVVKRQCDRSLKELYQGFDARSERVKGAFVVSDPVDWGRDIQVLVDILGCDGLPGKEKGHQPPLYFANDDLDYQAAFPTERLGMGAFRIALESIFNSTQNTPMEYTSFGKPNPFVFKNAEAILSELATCICQHQGAYFDVEGCQFDTLYMIGDNPAVDIKGAKKAGEPWFSILTRTGVFRGKDNHKEYPADLVVENVEAAVDYILTKEC